MPRERTGSGQVMPMVALMMVVLLGMVAFALDGANLYSQHRKLQADLDVAVKVAAASLANVSPSTSGYTSTVGTAFARAGQLLAADGYPNTLATATVQQDAGSTCLEDSSAGIVLCNPPQSGPFVGNTAYVEGRLSRDIRGFFGGVLGLGRMHISVRAVAGEGGYYQPYALIGLDPNGCSIQVQNAAGSSSTTPQLVVNGSTIADGQSCRHTSGGTALVNGSAGAVLPTTSGPNSPITGTQGTFTGITPAGDPYPKISLTAAATSTTPALAICSSGCSYNGFAGTTSSGAAYNCTTMISNTLGITTPQAGSTYYLPPTDGRPALVSSFAASGGAYYFLPHCDGSPAIYFFTDNTADLKLSGNGTSINSFNSVFVLDNSNDLVKETGTAKWVLNSPTSGPYQGIALTQNWPCTVTSPAQGLTLAGGAGSLINGVVDAPCAAITLSGNTANNPFVDGSVVGWDVIIAGNDTTTITYDPSRTRASNGSVLVE